MIEKLYPVPEVAPLLRCSKRTVLALIAEGRLRALKHCCPYAIPESEIQRFIKAELERSAGQDQGDRKPRAVRARRSEH
jgi:excisionase family DNA binding protein